MTELQIEQARDDALTAGDDGAAGSGPDQRLSPALDRRLGCDARNSEFHCTPKPQKALGPVMAAFILAIFWTCGLAIGVWMAKRTVQTAVGQFEQVVRARALGAHSLSRPRLQP